jgi:hypothetical protein
MTGATSGAEIAYPSGAPEFTPGFSGVHVTLSLVLCVYFVDHCLSFCPFSFVTGVVFGIHQNEKSEVHVRAIYIAGQYVFSTFLRRKSGFYPFENR